jgi:ankyrin repeat protein
MFPNFLTQDPAIFEQKIRDKINSLSDLKIRVILSEIFDEQKSVRSSDDLDTELVEIRDSWLAATDPKTQLRETMRVAYEYFAKRGLEKDSLKSGSEFEIYIAGFLTERSAHCAKIMYKFCDYLCQLSLKPEDQWEIFLQSFPPEGEFLNCLDGTEERIEKLHQALITDEKYKPLLRAHDVVMANAVHDLKDHVFSSNEVHIPSYLEYSLGLKAERVFHPQSQIPLFLAHKIHTSYSRKVKDRLITEIIDEVRQRRAKVEEIVSDLREMFPTFDPVNFQYDKTLNEALISKLKHAKIYNEKQVVVRKDFSMSLSRSALTASAENILALDFLDEFFDQPKTPPRKPTSFAQIVGGDASALFKSEIYGSTLGLLEPAEHLKHNPSSDEELLAGFEALWLMGEDLAGNAPITFLEIMKGLQQVRSQYPEDVSYLRDLAQIQIEKFLPNQAAKVERIINLYNIHKANSNFQQLDLDKASIGTLILGNAPIEFITRKIQSSASGLDLVSELESSLQSLHPQDVAYQLACEQLMLRPDYTEIFASLHAKIAQDPEHRAELPTGFQRHCLEAAASHNNADACVMLLDNFFTTDEIFLSSNVLHSASLHNNCELMELLLQKIKSQITAQDLVTELCVQIDGDGNTPLIVAATKDNVEIIKLLLTHSPDIVTNPINPIDEAHLMCEICTNGSVKTLKFLGELKPELLTAKIEEDNTPAHFAAYNGQDGAIRALREAGVAFEDFYSNNDEGFSPLYYAVSQNKKKVVEAIAEIGPNPAATQGLLQIAFDNNFATLVAPLARIGADLNQTNQFGSSLLHEAINKGQIDFVAALIRAGADFRTANAAGITPIKLALSQKRADVVKELASAGLDFCEIDLSNNNFLHRLALEKHGFRNVRTLSQAGIDLGALNTKNNQQETPIIIAASKGHKKFLRSLREAGVDLDAEDKFGLSAIAQIAKKISNVAPIFLQTFQNSIQCLKSAGADINHLNQGGQNVLHLAALDGNLKAVQILIALKADINQPDNSGNLPAYLAALNGRVDICQELLDAGNREKVWQKIIGEKNTEAAQTLMSAMSQNDFETICSKQDWQWLQSVDLVEGEGEEKKRKEISSSKEVLPPPPQTKRARISSLDHSAPPPIAPATTPTKAQAKEKGSAKEMGPANDI